MAKPTLFLFLLFMSGAVSPNAAYSAEPRRVCPPPQGIQAYQELNSRYLKLDRWRNSLVSRIEAQKAECKSVRNDQPGRVAECRRSREHLESDWGQYEDQVDSYRLALSHAIRKEQVPAAQEMKILKKRMGETRRKLSEIAKGDRQKKLENDLKEWAELGAGARIEALKAAKEAVVSLALQTLAIRNQKAVRLTREQRILVWRLSKKHGRVFNLIRASASHRLAELRTDTAILKDLSDLHTAADLSSSVFLNPDEREELLDAIAKILGVFVSDPRLGLVLTDAGVSAAAAYGWTKGILSKRRVDQLLTLSESRLKEVKALTSLYKKQIERLNYLKSKQESPPKLKASC